MRKLSSNWSSHFHSAVFDIHSHIYRTIAGLPIEKFLWALLGEQVCGVHKIVCLEAVCTLVALDALQISSLDTVNVGHS